ncbi:PAAR domain-containing protein [Pseudomonas chlororaphis]|uniref:PAAR domain-containing protein n=1 Tax=Pseudomonas chlororaphis TaxID=587753 RepID=UPI0023659779|nr:PAAR domain-containing protein [Pseudomonas chlororaphis]WDG51473.1 PAAR domain-containing protein [Pseudomonas chlororaphis]WDH87511.1 PAAR domain-containing protein [Pseudomonas chlororaphis]
MAFVIREGDPTTTGGKVIAGSGTTFVVNQRVARIADPVWCPVCQTVGFIAEGHHTWVDDQQATAVEGSLVQCGCPTGANRLVATQWTVCSGNQPTIPLDSNCVGPAVINTQRWADAIHKGYPQNEFADAVPRDQVRGLSVAHGDIVSPPLSVQDTQHLVEPGFHIVQTPITRAALETVLFGQADKAVLEKFRRLNPQLSNDAKPGQLVVLSHPDNYQCTREEALLMEAAEKVSAALASLSDEEAAFMLKHREQVESILSYGSTALGVSTAAVGNHMDSLKRTLLDIEALHQKFFLRDGHLRSVEFFSERKKLFVQLDANLTTVTKMSIAFPDHPKLKSALNISSRSLVHRWTQAGAVGQIPGYATQIEGVATASKVIKWGGWLGTALGGGASYVKVQDVCSAGNKQACEKVRFTEAGSFTGGVAGGMFAGMALGTAATGTVCVAIGVPTGGIGSMVCGLIVVGGGSYAAGKLGEAGGESIGEFIYEKGK